MITRRGFLGLMGAVAAAAAGLGCTENKPVTHNQTVTQTAKFSQVPWPYVKLDPDSVADIAYEGYMHHHCMYGVVNAVVQSLADKIGEPYSSFPTLITVYGKAGVSGWATLCGALNGAAMVCYMVLPEKEADAVINELFSWYEYTPLPEYVPEHPVKSDLSPFPKSKANSPLCHVSVSNWCKSSGYKAFSREREERCGRLAADVARKLVELLNEMKAGTFVPKYPLDNVTMKCRACHCKGSSLQNTRGKMACWECHTKNITLIDEMEGHPKI